MANQRTRIHTFFHCATCLQQKPVNQSPSDYNRTETGLTPEGLEVWCRRCRKQVGHFTPDQLRGLLEAPPMCDCCPGGRHAKPSPSLN